MHCTASAITVMLNSEKTSEASNSLSLRAVEMAFRLQKLVHQLNVTATSSALDDFNSNNNNNNNNNVQTSGNTAATATSSTAAALAADDGSQSDEEAVRKWRAMAETANVARRSSGGGGDSLAANFKIEDTATATTGSAGGCSLSFGIAGGEATVLFVGGINDDWLFVVGGNAVKRAQICSGAGGIVLYDDEWDAMRALAPSSIVARSLSHQTFELTALSGDYVVSRSMPIGIRAVQDELEQRLARRLEQFASIQAALASCISPLLCDQLLNGIDSAWSNHSSGVSVVTLRLTGLRFDEAHASEIHAVAQLLQSLALHYGGVVTTFAPEVHDALVVVGK